MSYIKKRKRREFIKSELLIFCRWIKTFWKFFFDRCALPPPRFWKSSRRRGSDDIWRISSERRLLFKSKRLRSRRKLLKAVWAELWKMLFYSGRIYLSEGPYRGIFIFSRGIRKEQSCSIPSGRIAGTSLWQVCFWSWKNPRPAERRERTDARPERPA